MKRAKHLLALLVVATLIITGVSFGMTFMSAETTAPKVLKLGYVGALTGGSAEQGTRQLYAMKLAVDKYNETRTADQPEVQVVEVDDRADPKEAATAANRFAADPDVIAVLGHINSSCTLAGAPIYNQAGLVHVTACSSSPAISKAGDYTFRIWNSDAYTASYNVTALLDLGAKTIGVIYENNDYGLGGYNVALETLAKHDMKPAVAEAFLLGETKDFSTIITKLKAAGVDGIYAVADETELGMFADQCAKQNYKPMITSAGTYSDVVIALGGEAANGMMGTTPYNPDNLPQKVQEFFEEFWARNADKGITTTDSISPTAYITGELFLDAIRAGNYTRESVKEYMTGRTWDTIVGELTFDENGDVMIPLQLMVIKDGKFADSGYVPKK